MKTKVLRRKPLRVTFDLGVVRRVSTPEGVACRIVDGYSYVNAWVGDGVNLTRESMVAATDDYNRWGAVRQMHQPSAVGRASGTADILNEEGQPETIALGVFWDAKGATCRSLIVDPEAIIKLDTGVYKAYSVGVAPTMMRGVDVVQCTWLENSLVDRPADPDAILTLVRGAESVDLTADVDVLQVVERVVNPGDGDSIPIAIDRRGAHEQMHVEIEGWHRATKRLLSALRATAGKHDHRAFAAEVERLRYALVVGRQRVHALRIGNGAAHQLSQRVAHLFAATHGKLPRMCCSAAIPIRGVSCWNVTL